MADGDERVVFYPPPVCLSCKHYRRFKPDASNPPLCRAFPAGIPTSIWPKGGTHIAAIEGDHGLRFEQDPRYTPVADLLALRLTAG